MSIVRSPRPFTNFSILDNRIAEDSSLSWGARGLLVFLLSKPDNWSISVSHLIRCTRGAKKKTGRDGVYALINELIEEGYLTRVAQSKVDGKFSEMEYVVHDVKQDKKACSNTDLPDTGKPHTDLPDTGKPHTANPTLTRTDIKQELISNNNGVKNNTRQARNGLYETEFEEVWNAYPKRPGSSKAAALKAFVARRNAGHSLETILSGVRAYSAYCIAKVSDSSYIKHLSTFLGAGEFFLSDWSIKTSTDTNAGVKGSLGSILLAVQNEMKDEANNGN